MLNKNQIASKRLKCNPVYNLKVFFAYNSCQSEIQNQTLPSELLAEIVGYVLPPFEEIANFLKSVVEGEQDAAEDMLQKNPELCFYPGNVTDLSGRTFNNITGFQYAVWALDSHIQLLSQLLSKDKLNFGQKYLTYQT